MFTNVLLRYFFPFLTFKKFIAMYFNLWYGYRAVKTIYMLETLKVPFRPRKDTLRQLFKLFIILKYNKNS